jgi:uncharacterized protein YndB with AHSA1/START domain
MDEPRTCGKGLAERSALPARPSALVAAIADVLERHQQARGNRHSRGTRARRRGNPRDVDRGGSGDARRFTGGTMSGLETEGLLLTRVPITNTGMLIRKPVADVFDAIVNPEITTQFWFTRSSGRLVAGRPIRWDWEMYDVSIQVTATVIEPNRRIVIEWPGYSGPTTVEWTFAPVDDGTTFVRVTESGFTGTGDQLVKYVADSTQGFTLMLAGLKALLEHGVRLNLVGDRYPKGVDEHELTKDG